MIVTSSNIISLPAQSPTRQGVVLPDVSGSVERKTRDSGAVEQASLGTQTPASSGSATDDLSVRRVPAGKAADKSSQDDDPQSLKARLQAEQEQADQQLIQQLRSRDREVRMHEQAHASVGGRYAGTPQYEFQRGPDGTQYAVGGEVSISTSKVSGDPQATLEKARVIRAAALAPAEPSSQDRRVAAKAAQLEIEARVDIQDIERTERQQETESAESREERVPTDEEAESSADEDANTKPELPELPLAQSAAQEDASGITTPGTASSDADARNDDSDRESEQSNSRETARESLERILLAGKTVAQQLNEMGLIDAQNPNGKSGLIEFIV